MNGLESPVIKSHGGTDYIGFANSLSVCEKIVKNNLIDYAKLKNDALIIGVVNKIEIWNPKLLESAEKDFHEIESSEFDELANQIIL